MTACGGAIAVAPLVPGACAGLRIAREEPDPDLSIRGRIGALIAAEAGALVHGEDGAAFPLDIETRARALLVAASPSSSGPSKRRSRRRLALSPAGLP